MKEALAFLVFGLVVATFVGFIGYAIYYKLAHPCVRYESRAATCGGNTYCVMYSNASTIPDGSSYCILWQTDPEYPCTKHVCVERKP